MKPILLVTAALIVVALNISPASATTIDMENLPSGSCASLGSTTVMTQGFVFQTLTAGNDLFACDGGVVSQDPTRSLIDANGPSHVLLSAGNTSLFSLNSFDAGPRTFGSDPSTSQGSSQVKVVGNLVGGGSISQIFNFNGPTFQNFVLSSTFTNLVSAEFVGIGFSNNLEIDLDNIVVTSH